MLALAFLAMPTLLPSCGGDDDEPDAPENVDKPNKAEVDDSRIFGTWEGEFFDTTFILTFSESGKMTEKVDGETGTYDYKLKNGSLTITPDNSMLNNIMGYDIKVKFSGSNSMTIECDLWDMKMKKK